ncbi:MAG: hypothetical protein AAF485_31020 [Chloroflexota bacterium]
MIQKPMRSQQTNDETRALTLLWAWAESRKQSPWLATMILRHIKRLYEAMMRRFYASLETGLNLSNSFRVPSKKLVASTISGAVMAATVAQAQAYFTEQG